MSDQELDARRRHVTPSIFQVMPAQKGASSGGTSGPRQAKIGEDERAGEALDLRENQNESGEACVGACLVPPNSQLYHYVKRRFPVTSNLRYMHGVLNVDEIKN